MFCHYVITKFNIFFKLPRKDNIRDIDTCVNTQYLSERFNIFKTYTVPSLLQQTCKNFKWIILFSDNTPTSLREEISALNKENDIIIPMFLDDRDSLQYCSILGRYLISENGTAEHFLTTRLDNDDALHEQYIQKVQNIFLENNRKGKYLISFKNGLQYDVGQQIYRIFNYDYNHFTTLIADNGEAPIDVVYNYDHTKVNQQLDVKVFETDEPMWLELCHKTNVSNHLFAVNENNICTEPPQIFQRIGASKKETA